MLLISILRDLLKIQRLSLGSPKIFNFWGEEKWRQTKLACEFILQAHFDEAPVAITCVAPCKKDLFRFLRACEQGLIISRVFSLDSLDFSSAASRNFIIFLERPREFLSRFAQTIGFAVF